jgi:hypothetical protein
MYFHVFCVVLSCLRQSPRGGLISVKKVLLKYLNVFIKLILNLNRPEGVPNREPNLSMRYNSIINTCVYINVYLEKCFQYK